MVRHWRIPAVILACLTGAALARQVVSGLVQRTSAAGGIQITAQRISFVVPPSGDAVESRGGSTDGLIRHYQAAVHANPEGIDSFIGLARAYMQKERETGDVTYYTLTDRSVQAALRLDPNNYAAVNLEAWVAMGRHDFRHAAQLSRQAIRLNPHAAANYGDLGDAEANLGNYDVMAQAYQRMNDLQPGLSSYNRASYARWLYGDLPNAYRYMRMAIRAGSTLRENVAWCETQLGDDYMEGGYVLGARTMYEEALQSFPHYARALAGLAAVDIALGNMRAAVKHYREAIAIAPLPQYVIALGDLYTRLGNRVGAEREYKLVDFIDHLFAVNHVRYGIETAQFYADHNRNLAQALRIARSEARVRHDVQTMDTLAWVLYKNGRYQGAWRAEKSALRLGTKSGLFYFHAGMIQAARGDVYAAQAFLHNALMLNPNFHVLYSSTARTELRRLGAMAVAPASRAHAPAGR